MPVNVSIRRTKFKRIKNIMDNLCHCRITSAYYYEHNNELIVAIEILDGPLKGYDFKDSIIVDNFEDG